MGWDGVGRQRWGCVDTGVMGVVGVGRRKGWGDRDVETGVTGVVGVGRRPEWGDSGVAV